MSPGHFQIKIPFEAANINLNLQMDQTIKDLSDQLKAAN
jgi:hypothetical protein